MTTVPTSIETALDQIVAELRDGSRQLPTWTAKKRIEVLERCTESIAGVAKQWVNAACEAKRIPPDAKARAEEITGGPVAVLRHLRLLAASFADIDLFGEPNLPGQVKYEDGRLKVKVFPTKQLYDSLLFAPLSAETWLQPHVSKDHLFSPIVSDIRRPAEQPGCIVCVLGAGNVASIPVTDTLSKIFQENKAVLLKMNPVNEYLCEIFRAGLSPLIEANLLRIITGGAKEGRLAVHHPDVDEVHITGSHHTHDAIVWGADETEREQNRQKNQPVLRKPITSELGNVTPWIVVPGQFSKRQLNFQAENIAASITNNASFNCIATKLIVTWRDWPDRERFLDLVDEHLRKTPRRFAYYPAALQRFSEYSGAEPDQGEFLPWTILRNIDVDRQSHLLKSESFVCVCAEVALEAANPIDLVQRAVAFVNQEVWGTLAASLTVPSELRGDAAIASAIRDLRYGTIGINQWSAIAFALMSPPWGAFPGGRLQDVQSGIGFVHNTYLLNSPEKTVLRSPLSFLPKPVWFASHRCPESVSWNLLRLYTQPSVWKLPRLAACAAVG